MRLNDNYILYQSDKQVLLIPTADASFHGLVQGNKTVESVLRCLQENTTREKIIEAIYERFDAERDVIAEDVDSILCKLKKIGAIDE